MSRAVMSGWRLGRFFPAGLLSCGFLEKFSPRMVEEERSMPSNVLHESAFIEPYRSTLDSGRSCLT